jgi:aryl-alcohol dehydrogenase-like predicted oxidoreductase
MQQRPLGRSGLAVSRLALGTMTWGRDTEVDDAAAQLKTFLDAGGTLLDTADVYADGEAEAVVGTLLGPLVARDELVVATKAGLRPSHQRRRDGSRGHLLATLDASLRRLGTDHVDLWTVHGHDPHTPLEETLSALDHAVTSGRARYVGVANFSGWQTAQAATWQAAWPGRAPLVCAQVEYSLLERGVEREVLPACAALGLGVLPWSPPGRLQGGVAALRAVRHAVPDAAVLGDRGGGRHGRRRVGRVAGPGRARLGARPARRRRPGARRAHGRPTARRAAGRGRGAAAGDQPGVGRRVVPGGRISGAPRLSHLGLFSPG